MKSSVLILSLLVILYLPSFGQSTYGQNKFGVMDFVYLHSVPKYHNFPICFKYKHQIQKSRFWISQDVTGVTFVNRGMYYNYSAKGLISLSNCIISGLISKNRIISVETMDSPIFKILSIPNSQIEFSITKLLYVGFINNTEYILFRGKTGYKGVYYTPALTFSIFTMAYDEGADTYELQLLLGYTTFWNFEGRNESIGWTFGFRTGFGFIA
ncbi:MAG: hypothetical protein ABIJ12_07170 [bacterium]